MDGCCGGMWESREFPDVANDGGGCNRVTTGSYLASLAHGHPI